MMMIWNIHILTSMLGRVFLVLALHQSLAVPRVERSLDKPFVPVHNTIVPIREAKAHTVPIVTHVVVPNLHVIPIHQVHSDGHIVSHTITHSNHTAPLVPVLIPIHNLVPVHDLTVIPLRKTEKIDFSDEPVSRYRHPLGGYGAGWYYGGHGAGHGFHYAYG